MVREIEHKNISISENTIVFLALLITLFVGTVVGSLVANSLNEEKTQKLQEYTKNYINKDSFNFISKKDRFKDSLLKYGKNIIILWIVAFIPIGFVMSFFIIFFKGASYGFTTAFLVMNSGFQGLKLGFKLYFFQNIFLIIAYLLLAFFGFKYSFKSKNRLTKNNFTSLEYFIVFLLSLILVFLACGIEVFLLEKIV